MDELFARLDVYAIVAEVDGQTTIGEQQENTKVR
jgi:hypothetical protein